MSVLVWTILYGVSVVGIACLLFMIVNKDVLTLDEVVVGAVISLIWPLVAFAILLTIALCAVIYPFMLFDDYCQRRFGTKDVGKIVVWRRGGGS